MFKPNTNTGVIINVQPTDFIAGSITGLVPEILEASGQYDLDLPSEERQRLQFETSACVTFSALNALETIFDYKVKHNLFTPNQIKFLVQEGYISPLDGKVNFSDRYIAKLSGTTPDGNSFTEVGNTIDGVGLVPESDWPWSASVTNWSEYYGPIPQEIKDKGQRFNQHFKTRYQWVVNNQSSQAPSLIKAHLPFGPIQIATQTSEHWSDGTTIIPATGCTCQHATLIYGQNDGLYEKDFDQYNPFKKELAWDYCIPYALQYYVNGIDNDPVMPDIIPKPADPLAKPQHYFGRDLYKGDVGLDVTWLQKCLAYEGLFTASLTGTYGKITAEAVFAFQRKYNIANWAEMYLIPDTWYGSKVGPKTRAKLNQLYNTI